MASCHDASEHDVRTPSDTETQTTINDKGALAQKPADQKPAEHSVSPAPEGAGRKRSASEFRGKSASGDEEEDEVSATVKLQKRREQNREAQRRFRQRLKAGAAAMSERLNAELIKAHHLQQQIDALGMQKAVLDSGLHSAAGLYAAPTPPISPTGSSSMQSVASLLQVGRLGSPSLGGSSDNLSSANLMQSQMTGLLALIQQQQQQQMLLSLQQQPFAHQLQGMPFAISPSMRG